MNWRVFYFLDELEQSQNYTIQPLLVVGGNPSIFLVILKGVQMRYRHGRVQATLRTVHKRPFLMPVYFFINKNNSGGKFGTLLDSTSLCCYFYEYVIYY